jgi:hypothetical protein
MENPFLEVAKRLAVGNRDTLEMTALGSTAEGTRIENAQPEVEPGDDSSLLSDKPIAIAPKPMAETLVDEPSDDKADHRGKIGEARRILVECGLCGFLVRIPAEFFGKTVHCPECAGNTIFTESTLDPVKDELIDRLIMETRERRVLFPSPGARAGWPEPLQALARAFDKKGGSSPLKSFMLGVGLGLLVLVGAWIVVRGQRASERSAIVENAERDGWRYATAINASSDVVHEPWCLELEGGLGRRLSDSEFQQSGESITLHPCE